jgi:hypothetical protein
MRSVTVAGYLDNIENPDVRRLAKKVRLLAKKPFLMPKRG